MKKKLTTRIFHKFNVDQDVSIELNIDIDIPKKSNKTVTFYDTSKLSKNKKNANRKLF